MRRGFAMHSLLRRTGSFLALLALAGAAGADDRVYPTPEAVQPLQPGASVPAVQVEKVSGEEIDLAERTREHGALLVFYRGGW